METNESCNNHTEASGSPCSKQKILLVDDRQENLHALEKTLSILDVEIFKATNGNDALAATLDHEFSLAILDVMMPGMSGYELAEHLRGDEKTQLLPIVFLTASYTDEMSAFKGYEAGGFDYIFKPYSPDILLAKVRVLLELDLHRKHLEDMVQARTERIRHLNSVLQAIRDVNQLIVREKRPDRLIQQACRELLEARGFYSVWIALLDKSGKLDIAAEAGLEKDFRHIEEKLGRGEMTACARKAMQQSGAIIIKDPLSTCGDCPAAGKYPDHAGMIIRLEYEGRIYGLMVLAIQRRFADDEEELGLFEEIAGDIAFALHNIQVEKERARAKETLTQQAAIIESSNDAIVSKTLEGIITSWNAGAQRMYGYSAEEMIGQSDALISPPECAAELNGTLARIGDGKVVNRLETTRLRKDGTRIEVSLTISPIRNAEGKVVGASSIARDITESKRVECALRASEEKFHSIVDNIGIGVSLIGPDMEILELNRQMREWFAGIDLSQRPLCYRAFHEPPGEGVCDYCPTVKTLQDGQVHEATTQTPQAQGIRSYRIIASPIRNAQGEVTAAIEIVEDITERTQLEEQLNQAMKMEAVGRLAGGVAHDFNNALTPILAISDILLTKLDPKQQMYEDIQEIKESGERCANLTRQLLAFGRRQPLNLTVLNLNDVVVNVEKMLSRVIGEDIELVKVLDPDLKNVKADVGQMEQILANLAVNSRDAMPTGGKLTIETQNVELDAEYASKRVGVTPGRYAMLAVSDTGVGMDEKTRAQIFEPFFTTKEKGKGTGLGLASVYGIVKQIGGNIWVYSEPGKGTTFKIYIPCVDEELEEQSRQEEASTVSYTGSETVLLVEDDTGVRKVISRVLTQNGYNVLEAGDGNEAIRLTEECAETIHLMVTDVVMPGMGGKELAARFSSSFPDMKVLFVSGYTENGVIHHGILEKGVHFIQKPFAPEAIVRKVREILDKAKS